MSRELSREHSVRSCFGLLLVLAACIGCGDGSREPDRADRVGDLSEPLATQPTLLAPIGDTTNSPVFRWSAAPGTLSYRLWVDDASGPRVVDRTLLASAVGCPTGTEPECAYSPGYVLAPGVGKFWVLGIDSAGPGPWSAAANFFVSVPKLIAPAGAVSTGTPTYQWNSVPGATSYQLWVDDSTQKAKIKQVVTPTDAGCASGGICSDTPSTAVAPGNAKWWVRAGTGVWSAPLSFNVTINAPINATINAFDFGFENPATGDNTATITAGGVVTFSYPSGGNLHNVEFTDLQPTMCTQTAGPITGAVPPLPTFPTPQGWSGVCRFNTPGTYGFFCQAHSFEVGTVVVH